MKKTFLKIILAILFITLPAKIFACAACYGQVDAPMAEGMNWGIFTLMGVIVSVLGSISAFFVFIIRKSSSVATAEKSAKSQNV